MTLKEWQAQSSLKCRPFNALWNSGYKTVEEVCELTPEIVLRLRNSGPKTLENIRFSLSQIGESLKNDMYSPMRIQSIGSRFL